MCMHICLYDLIGPVESPKALSKVLELLQEWQTYLIVHVHEIVIRHRHGARTIIIPIFIIYHAYIYM